MLQGFDSKQRRKRRISMRAQNKALAMVSFLLVIAMVFPAFGQQPSSQTAKGGVNPPVSVIGTGSTQKLPLRRVVLYKSGVGYFEHGGKVHGNEDVEIDLTSSQLDDVLKSLTALDLNGGRIVGANYNSQDPAGHQLESLPVAISDKSKLSELLEELRGARMEVKNAAGAFTGRLISVEEKKADKDADEPDSKTGREQISLMADNGELRSFALTPSTSLRFVDRDLEQQLARALGLMDAAHQEDTRHLVLTTTGSGERELRVSYISEVPVWKTTYRLVLPTDASRKPLLQGWAIVDNTVGEDWNNVELSLAAGAPQSFIQQLSQPLYTRRPVVPLPQGAQITPQMHAGTLEEFGAPTATTITPRSVPGGYAGGVVGGTYGGNANTNANSPGGGRGIGSGSGGGVGSGIAAGLGPGDADGIFSAGNNQFNVVAAAQSINAAEGGSLGELFQYKLKDRVTIHKNQSALVPIVQAEVTAEKVALWNAGMNSPRPLSALWLTNTSGEVLDGGSFSVVDGGAFAGEGLVGQIQPDERRLISYAADLGMQVVMKGDLPPQVLTRILVTRGVMYRTVLSRQISTYTIRNEETQARTLILEHPVRTSWKLADNLKPEEKSATAYRFRVEVPAKGTKSFVVEETSPSITQIQLSKFDENTLQMFVSRKELTPELEQALRQILAQKDAIAKLDADIKQRQDDVQRVFQDQDRLRENMKALKGTPEEKALLQRYTGELNDEETQLAATGKEITDLEAKRKQAQVDLDATIANMAFNVKM
jgi:hypothetical protein